MSPTETETPHTPGPWIVERLESGDYDIGIRVNLGRVSGYAAFIRTNWPHEEQRLEQEANAALIARAPDMHANLLAAQELCLQLDHDKDALARENARLRDAVIAGEFRKDQIHRLEAENAQLRAANRELADALQITAQRLESLEPVHLNWHLAVGRIARAIRDALASAAKAGGAQ